MPYVAPFTGAWIEIAGRGRLDWPLSSLPSRERGLKFQSFRLLVPLLVSLPSRERGLKLKKSKGRTRKQIVAPFTGAWIEIDTGLPQIRGNPSLPSRERGLKLPGAVSLLLIGRRSLYGSVD